ncbi:NAD-dependent epimerase/dehydratase family protein [Bacteroides mediterraneensis]|uniref:NAD-dependent epimerase/dehydratase family protein n=1 Tax=Bacteroides mediterraneensis TaxID=1841856 RepID=A0ABS2EWY2_9BACE|nr:NAD-dependent epimerase/dehydratase family protein [Bacteroides mediterraneensis]MBM6759078.1 NAD-dependent epimerase/dehydratase family protein [Bacteroides mediterraneensis]
MKILVIGSKGFIGSHCVDFFSHKNEVWGCDVLIDYNTPNYLFIESVDSDFQDIFLNHKFDVCINCSGAASVPFSIENPYHDFQLNTLNVYKILESIRKFCPECRYISMSSAAVYGNPTQLPIKESSTLAPVSPYGIHKVMAEQICKEFSDFWNIKTCCIRIFSAYGPRLRKQLLWDISQKAIKQDKVLLYGTGNETRDFIYVSDVVSIINLAITHSDFNGEVINAANGKQETIANIANLMLKALSIDKSIIFNQEVRPGDPLNWEADITKIQNWGYTQQFNIETGINNYVSWLKENGLA